MRGGAPERVGRGNGMVTLVAPSTQSFPGRAQPFPARSYQEAPGLSILAMLGNAGWLLLAQLFAGGTLFGVSVLRARHLGVEDFGRWAFAASLVSLFSVLADFGLPVLAVRDLAQGRHDPRRYLSGLGLLALLLAVAVVALIALIEPWLSNDATVRWLVYLLGGQLVLNVVSGVLLAYVRASGAMYLETATRAFQGVFLVGLTSFLAVMDGGLIAFGWAVVAAALVGVCVPAPYIVSKVGCLGPRPDFALWRSLLREAWPIGLGMALTSIYYYLDALILGALGRETALGLYNASYLFVLAMALAVMALRTAFLPLQSRAFAGLADLSYILRQYGRLTAAVGVPVAVLGPLMASPLLTRFFGADYAAAAPALRLLLLAAGTMGFSSFYGSSLLVAGRQKTYLVGVGLGAGVNAGLNAVLIPLFSLYGAAGATLAAESAVMLFMFRQNRVWRTPSPLELSRWPLLASLAAAGAVVALGAVASFFVAITLGVVLYLSLAFPWLVGRSLQRQASSCA